MPREGRWKCWSDRTGSFRSSGNGAHALQNIENRRSELWIRRSVRGSSNPDQRVHPRAAFPHALEDLSPTDLAQAPLQPVSVYDAMTELGNDQPNSRQAFTRFDRDEIEQSVSTTPTGTEHLADLGATANAGRSGQAFALHVDLPTVPAASDRSSIRSAQPAIFVPDAGDDSGWRGRPSCACVRGTRACSRAYGFLACMSVSCGTQHPSSVHLAAKQSTWTPFRESTGGRSRRSLQGPSPCPPLDLPTAIPYLGSPFSAQMRCR